MAGEAGRPVREPARAPRRAARSSAAAITSGTRAHADHVDAERPQHPGILRPASRRTGPASPQRTPVWGIGSTDRGRRLGEHAPEGRIVGHREVREALAERRAVQRVAALEVSGGSVTITEGARVEAGADPADPSSLRSQALATPPVERAHVADHLRPGRGPRTGGPAPEDRELGLPRGARTRARSHGRRRSPGGARESEYGAPARPLKLRDEPAEPRIRARVRWAAPDRRSAPGAAPRPLPAPPRDASRLLLPRVAAGPRMVAHARPLRTCLYRVPVRTMSTLPQTRALT